MIHLKPDQFGQIMSFTNENQAVGTLIAALVDDYQGAQRQAAHFEKELNKAKKTIKSLERKLKVINILKSSV